KVRHEGHLCAPTWPTSTMKKHPVTAIALTLKAETIVRCAELGEFRLALVDARRMQSVDKCSRQQSLPIERALAEMQLHPVREIDDRGIDCTGSRGPDWETHGRKPSVLVHHIGTCRIGRCFELVQGEANGHAKPLCQPGADKGLIALPADAFD